MYNWQNHEWPNFEYELSLQTQEKLYLYAKETSRLVGAMQQIAENAEDALLEILVLEGQKTSEIEGEIINAADIRSSLRKNTKDSNHTAAVTEIYMAGANSIWVCFST